MPAAITLAICVEVMLLPEDGRVSYDRFEVDHGRGKLAEVRARTLEPWDIDKGPFHGLGRIEQIAVATKAAGYLQTEGHGVLIDPARNGDRRIGDERDHIGQREPVIIVAQPRPLELPEIELGPRKR